MSIKKDILWRVYLVFGLIGVGALSIIFQAFKVQTMEGGYWRSMADSLTTAYRTIEAERGNVYAEDGSLLATSLPFFEVRMDLKTEALTAEIFNSHVDSLAWYLAEFDQSRTQPEWKRKLINERNEGERFLLIHRKVSYPDLLKMKQWPLFRLGKYKGGFISFQQNKRVTPFRLLAHRTIGYVREGIQPVGLEGAFDEYLAGVHGIRLVQKVTGGIEVPINDNNEIEPENGMDIISTIDINLQDVAEDALYRAIQDHKADHGCVVLMEVSTGKIKAIANLGRSGDALWETYNYAVGESTEPGSTFKLLSMIALLEAGMIRITDSVDIEKGVKQFYDETMKDSEEHDYRMVTVQKAFEISSNVGISKLIAAHFGKKPQAFINQIRSMDLHRKTGIEIAGEPEPVIKTIKDEDWSGISLPWMSVGYELQFTPLQLLTFYNAIANNGKMVKPYLVTAVQDYGRDLVTFKPQVINDKICSPSTLRNVRNLLEGVVEKGTARNIRSANFKMAGKTGTAMIADRKHGYKQVYQSSFAGYFPADKPLYSCIVVINAPKSGHYYGSTVAAPVFREIADKVYSNTIEMHQPINNDKSKYYASTIPVAKAGFKNEARYIYNQLGISFSQPNGVDWVWCRKKDNSIEMKEREWIKNLVPNVLGMGLKDALYLLENEGLRVMVVGRGRVKKQSIPPGLKAKDYETITIELG